MKYMFSLLMVFLCLTYSANSEWSEDKIDRITKAIQEKSNTWTEKDTIEIMNKSNGVGSWISTISTDKETLFLKIEGGETVLLGGKDISGNLGSKTTYGDHSPIIEDVKNSKITTGDKSPILSDESKITELETVKDSQITTGDKSPIEKDKSSVVSVNVSLKMKIALSLSFMLNLYFIVTRRKKKSSREKGGD